MHQFQAEFLKIAEGNGKEMERLGEIERQYYAVFEQPAEMKDFDAVYESAAEIQRILCENFKVEKGQVEVNPILSLQKAIRMIVREFQGNFKRCSCIVSLKVVFDTVGDMLEEIEKLIADKNNARLKVVRVKNGFCEKISNGGYRYLAVDLLVNNRMVCQVECHLKSFYEIRNAEKSEELNETLKRLQMDHLLDARDAFEDMSPMLSAILNEFLKTDMKGGELMDTYGNLMQNDGNSRSKSHARAQMIKYFDSQNPKEDYEMKLEMYKSLCEELKDDVDNPILSDSRLELLELKSKLQMHDQMSESINECGTSLERIYKQYPYPDYFTLDKLIASKEHSLDSLNRIFATSQDILGSDHMMTLKVQLDIASELVDRYEFAEAESIIIQVRNILSARYSANSPKIVDLEIRRALLSQMSGDYKESIEILKEKVEKVKMECGENSLAISKLYLNLSACFEASGETETALELAQKCLNIRIEKLGDVHTDVAEALDLVGSCLHSKSEFSQAISSYEQALAIYILKYGPDHLLVSDSYFNISSSYASNMEVDRSLDYLNRALSIRRNKFGDSHPDLIATYTHFGLRYHQKGEYERSLEFYNKALQIQLENFGEEHSSVANSYFSLGNLSQTAGKPDEAIDYFNKALEINTKIYGADHPHLAITYNQLGSLFKSKSEFERAIYFFDKSLACSIPSIGEDHPNIGVIYTNLGHIYQKQKEIEKAVKYFEKSYTIKCSKFGKDHSTSIRALTELNLANSQIRKNSGATLLRKLSRVSKKEI
jgi:tetratricopeptide (TPR) repeat protein